LSNYMIAGGRGDTRFVAIPVFPSRVFRHPADIRVDNIEKDQTLDDLLEAGNLDAVAVTSAPRGFRRGSPVIRRLFSNARDAEAEYYRQTKIFPIMHVVVIRRAVYDRYPQLSHALGTAF